MSGAVIRRWPVQSSSAPGTFYDVTEREDTVHGGTYLHCMCQGWGPSRGKGRDCKHVAHVRAANSIPDDAALLDNRARALGYPNSAAAVASTGKPDNRIFAGESMKELVEEERTVKRYSAFDAIMRGEDIVAQRYDVFHTAVRGATTERVRWHCMAANELDAMAQAMADGRTNISAIASSEQFQLDNSPDFDTTEWAANTERKER